MIIDPNHDDPKMSSKVGSGLTRLGKILRGGTWQRKTGQDSAKRSVKSRKVWYDNVR